MENSRNKQLSFKLHAVLSSRTKPRTVPLHPSWGVNHVLSQCLHTVQLPTHELLSGHLGYLSNCWYCSACVQVTFTVLNNGPNAQES